jgi:hypothetical protein
MYENTRLNELKDSREIIILLHVLYLRLSFL